jgi:hypothetical protein
VPWQRKKSKKKKQKSKSKIDGNLFRPLKYSSIYVILSHKIIGQNLAQ